ncbi:MAG TPA: DMT family transporter [Geminicoccaceae bacterium]|nr:DMT family transporter [Geminicoccaceae bacterium]
MLTILMIAVVVAGAALSVQPLINARMAAAAGHPIFGAMISVMVSTLTLALAALLLRLPLPSVRALAELPPWTWLGGVIGATVVLSALMVAPRVGVATAMALFIAGQLAAALAMDHFGLLGLDPRPLGPMRVLGAACLLAGVLLIRRF